MELLTALEPEQGNDTTNTNVFFEHFGDAHTCVKEFLATFIGDSGDEGSGLPDETKFLFTTR